MSRVTQADVVRAAIKQLSKRGGYTAETYFARKDGGYTAETYFARKDGGYAEGPGANVGATCAIGGVEQAIWSLTGDAVCPDFLGGHNIRYRLASSPSPTLNGDETPRQKLYASVVRKLNAKARKLFPEIDGEEIETVEEVTYEGTKTASRRRTLQVFESVLADLEQKAKASA